MSHKYDNAIICQYIVGVCHEKYSVFNSNLEEKSYFEFVNGSPKGCAFDKVFKLDEPYVSVCYIEADSHLRCTVEKYIGEYKFKTLTNQLIASNCDHEIMHTDSAYFSDGKFVAVCRNIDEKKRNPVAHFITFNGEDKTPILTSRSFELETNFINYPFVSKFGEKFYAIFYNINEKTNVFEILDLPFCADHENVTVYVNAETAYLTLGDKIAKAPGIYTEQPDVIFVHLPESGQIFAVNDNGEEVEITDNNKSTHFNKDTLKFKYIASNKLEPQKLTYAGTYKEEDTRGKLCKIFFIIEKCPEGCYSCHKDNTSSSLICDNVCREGQDYHPYYEDPTTCVKDPPGYYLDEKDKTIPVPQYKRCASDCKTCLTGEENGNSHCETCKDKNGVPAYIIDKAIDTSGNCYTEEEGNNKGYYLDGDTLKKCYETCGTCKEYGELKCETCIDGTTYGFENITKKCDYDTSSNEGYYFNDTATPKQWKVCYETCHSCYGFGDEKDNNCNVCKIDLQNPYYKTYKETKMTNCSQTAPPGHYLDEPTDGSDKTFKPCDEACEECYGKNNNIDFTNCKKCSSGYSKYEDQPKRCEIVTPDYYYKDDKTDPNEPVFRKCFDTCKTCHGSGVAIPGENNCIDCKPGHYHTELSNKACMDDSTSDGYYLHKDNENDESTWIYKVCDKACATCSGPGDTDCKTCANGYYLLHGTNNCLSKAPDEHYFNGQEFKPCQKGCLTCEDADGGDDMRCKKCISDYYKVILTNNCFSDPHDGYYKTSNDTVDPDNPPSPDEKVFKKCNEACNTCNTGESKINTNCKTCKQNPVYKMPEDVFGNCLLVPPEKYYDDGSDTFKKCHKNCLTCKGQGTNELNNCDKCLDGYVKIDNSLQCSSTIPPHTYPDRVNGEDIYKKCDPSCEECTGPGPNECTSCRESDGYYKYIASPGALMTCLNINNKKSNEYLDENDNVKEIKKCDISCATCSGTSTHCLTCSNGYHNIINRPNTCVKNPDGYYLDKQDNQYHPCHSTCKKCERGEVSEDDHQCTKCIDGATKDDKTLPGATAFNCYAKCPEGEKLYQGVCQKCGDYLVEGTNSCINCKVDKNGQFHIKKGTECLSGIKEGYYDIKDNYGTIEPCDTKCLTCKDQPTKCVSCKKDSQFPYLVDEDCKSDCPYYLGKNTVDKTCNNCSPKYKSKDQSDYTCKDELPPGTKVTDSKYNVYEPCYQNCNRCSDISNNPQDQRCIECIDKYFFENSESKNCVETCDQYLVQDPVSRKCINCKTFYAPNIKYHDMNDNTRCKDKSEVPGNALIVDEDSNSYSLCFERCSSCISKSTDPQNQLCKACLSPYYLLFNSNNCEAECGEKYGAKDSTRTCVNCKNEGNGQFKFKTEKECTETKPSNAYITDKDFNIIETCPVKCSECSDLTGACKKCNIAEGYGESPVNSNECILLCDSTTSYWYINGNNEYKCTTNKSCTDPNFSILEETNGQCVSSCGDASGCLECTTSKKYEHQGKCLSDCPAGYTKNDANNKCEQEITTGCSYSTSTTDKTDLSEIQSFALSQVKDSYQKIASSAVNNKILTITGAKFVIEYFKSDECELEASTKLNLSYVNLTECKANLTKSTGVTDIYFAKVEIFQDPPANTRVVFQAYDPSGEEMDMSPCKEVSIEMPLGELNKRIAGTLSTFKVNFFDKKDPFFNDFCYPYYDSNGKDVILKDRRKDFYQNMTVCEAGCDTKINFKTAKVECKCSAKNTSIDQINKVISDIPVDGFDSLLNIDNLIVVRCYNLVFNWRYMKKNIGSWLMLLLFIAQWPGIITFIIVGLKPLYAYLNHFTEEKELNFPGAPPKKQKEESESESESESDEESDEKSEENGYEIEKGRRGKGKSSQRGYIQARKESVDGTPAALVDKMPKRKLPLLDLDNNTRSTFSMNTKTQKMNYINSDFKRETSIQSVTVQNNSEREMISKEGREFDEDDLNEMVYDDAKQYDNRSVCKFFWVCLKLKLLILSPFSNVTPLEPFMVRLTIFFINISFCFVMNGILFDEEQISKRYNTDNIDVKYFFENEFPRCIYSSIACTIIGFILSFITTNKKRFKTIIDKEEDPKIFLQKTKKIVRSLKCKIVSFLIINVILMSFFWYYVSAFCAVYQKTQKDYLIGSSITILLCLIFQTLYSLLITIFRYIGLKCKCPCLYTCSKYFL